MATKRRKAKHVFRSLWTYTEGGKGLVLVDVYRYAVRLQISSEEEGNRRIICDRHQAKLLRGYLDEAIAEVELRLANRGGQRKSEQEPTEQTET